LNKKSAIENRQLEIKSLEGTCLLSSPDNPQIEPQPEANAEPQVSPPIPAGPFAPDLAGLATATPVPAAPPVENPVWSGWDVLVIAALTFVTMIVLQLAVLLGAHWWRYRHESLSDVAQKPIILLVSQFLIYAAVAAFMVMLVEGKYHAPFWQAIRWNWPRAQWRLLALGAVMFLGLGLLENLMPMPKDTPFEHLFDRPRDAYLISLIAVTLGPLMEELFFRGFMYPVLARRMGVLWGIILTALPFGLIHLPQYGWAWGAALVIFLVGVVCGAVRAATKSVAASFLVHVGYNGAQMVIALVATHGFRHLDAMGMVSF
jgi:membrane protease YdiL (CAAX protease family)